jgi:N-acetylmuramoyl-L-alanine amidase
MPAAFSSAAVDRETSPDFSSLEKRYQQAKFYYNELHTNTTLGASRGNWMNGVRNFRKIYLSGPKSDFAAPSLYMLGRMYSKMYRRFKNDLDIQEAISYYRDVSDLFPDNSLADDALYAVGNLYLNKKNNPQKAAEHYTRIIANYRNGDMYAHIDITKWLDDKDEEKAKIMDEYIQSEMKKEEFEMIYQSKKFIEKQGTITLIR